MSTLPTTALINTPCSFLEDDRLEPPLGILYLATLLHKNGYPCQICDLSSVPESEWLNQIPPADIYGFSTYSVTYHETVKIKNMVTAQLNPKALTIAGGPHATALPEESNQDFDVVIMGEAEQAMLSLVESVSNGVRPKGIQISRPINDLDELPFPDFELVDLDSYHRIVEGSPCLSILTSRGCPYSCVFCNSQLFSRGQLRFRSPNNVQREIVALQEKYQRTSFRFSDDLFTFSPERITQMTNVIKPLDIVYRVYARSNTLTPKAADQLYDSGCRHAAIGIESMSAKMLTILEKNATVEVNVRALKNAKAAGIKTRIFLLVGYPGETEATVRETIHVLEDCDFDEFVIYPFIPYPGTALWYHPERWGAQIDRDFSKYIQVGKGRQTCFAVQTADFSPEDVERWRAEMTDALEKKVHWASMLPDTR